MLRHGRVDRRPRGPRSIARSTPRRARCASGSTPTSSSGSTTDIEDAGLELGAIYHSHTRTEPRPSQTDINFAKLWPGVLWIIVGLEETQAEVRTWRIDDGQVSDAELVVE